VFQWTPETTRFEWGGVAPRALASIDDVRQAVLSGLISEAADGW
jgi:hypothetical protein